MRHRCDEDGAASQWAAAQRPSRMNPELLFYVIGA